MIRHSDRLLTALLAVLLLWAPLPFGGAVPWAEASLRVLAFGCLAAAMVAGPLSSWRRVALPAAALAGVALFGLLQSLRWPAGLAAALSPEHARLWSEAGSLLGMEAAGPRLTLAAAATRSAALDWAAAAACLVAAAVAGRERAHRRVLTAALLAGGLFQVIFGSRGWFARATTIWGVEVTSNPARLRGTFVNSNHLALYLGLALTAAFAWGWWSARRAAEEPRPERKVAMLAPPVLLWLTLFAGLAFTGSRAGLLAAVAAVSAQGVLLAGAGAGWRWRTALLGLAAAALGLGMVAAIGFREGLGRIATTAAWDVSLGARLDAYRAALDLWWRFPWTGTGLGAFRDAFPLVQPAALEGTWWHAHSDLLEVPVTVGALGTALVAVGVWGLGRRLLAVLRHGNRSEDRAAALAVLGGLVGLAVHEALDFGLTMPGNALTVAVLAGAAAAARTQASAQAHVTRQDAPPHEGLDLEEVKPAADRDGRSEGQRPAARTRSRPDRKRSQRGTVEP
jgi:O-antigen ligase